VTCHAARVAIEREHAQRLREATVLLHFVRSSLVVSTDSIANVRRADHISARPGSHLRKLDSGSNPPTIAR